jgi:hypothetical protein
VAHDHDPPSERSRLAAVGWLIALTFGAGVFLAGWLAYEKTFPSQTHRLRGFFT